MLAHGQIIIFFHRFSLYPTSSFSPFLFSFSFSYPHINISPSHIHFPTFHVFFSLISNTLFHTLKVSPTFLIAHSLTAFLLPSRLLRSISSDPLLPSTHTSDIHTLLLSFAHSHFAPSRFFSPLRISIGRQQYVNFYFLIAPPRIVSCSFCPRFHARHMHHLREFIRRQTPPLVHPDCLRFFFLCQSCFTFLLWMKPKGKKSLCYLLSTCFLLYSTTGLQQLKKKSDPTNNWLWLGHIPFCSPTHPTFPSFLSLPLHCTPSYSLTHSHSLFRSFIIITLNPHTLSFFHSTLSHPFVRDMQFIQLFCYLLCLLLICDLGAKDKAI